MRKRMTEEEVQHKLESWLIGRSNAEIVPAQFWREQNIKKGIKDYIDGEVRFTTLRMEIEDHFSFGRRFAQYSSGNGTSMASQNISQQEDLLPDSTPLATPDLSSYERARVEAYSAYIANEAALPNDKDEDDVPRFRKDILEDQQLTAIEAEQFVTQSALRYFSLEERRRWSIPLLDSTAEVVDQLTTVKDDGTYHIQLKLRIHPGDILYQTEYTLQKNVNVWQQFIYQVGQQRKVVSCTPPSIIGRLWRLSQKLADRYMWKPDTAMCFILTGSYPQVRPMIVSVQSGQLPGAFIPPEAAITLTVAPWIAQERVQNAYRSAQQHFFGHINKPSSIINLKVFRFVEECKAVNDGKRLPWRELTEAWNRDNGHEKVYSSFRVFRRDYYRAEQILFGTNRVEP